MKDAIRRLLCRPYMKYRIGKTLDVGCGDNVFSGDAVCIDTDIRKVLSARRRGFNADVMDAQRLKFKKASFDTVLMIHVLEHIKEGEKAVSEASRVLRKGGRLILVHPDLRSYELARDTGHMRHYCPYELVHMMHKNKFRIIDSGWKTMPYTRNMTFIKELYLVCEKL